MEKVNDLKDLLQHELEDLCSAEEQIIDAMPNMIEKASNPQLKKQLIEHLAITETQRLRLDQVLQLLNNGADTQASKSGGFLSSLFGGGSTKCKGMEGLITEAQKIMHHDMSPKVIDAALIASAQKIEHYEICGYGTVKAFAEELGLQEVAALLEQTLNEEYQADDLLTLLAERGVNEKAEGKSARRNGTKAGTKFTNNKKVATKANAPAKKPVAKSASKKNTGESKPTIQSKSTASKTPKKAAAPSRKR